MKYETFLEQLAGKGVVLPRFKHSQMKLLKKQLAKIDDSRIGNALNCFAKTGFMSGTQVLLFFQPDVEKIHVIGLNEKTSQLNKMGIITEISLSNVLAVQPIKSPSPLNGDGEWQIVVKTDKQELEFLGKSGYNLVRDFIQAVQEKITVENNKTKDTVVAEKAAMDEIQEPEEPQEPQEQEKGNVTVYLPDNTVFEPRGNSKPIEPPQTIDVSADEALEEDLDKTTESTPTDVKTQNEASDSEEKNIHHLQGLDVSQIDVEELLPTLGDKTIIELLKLRGAFKKAYLNKERSQQDFQIVTTAINTTIKMRKPEVKQSK